MMRKTFFLAILVMLVTLFLEGRAYAYIDPGTGSYVFQAIIAVFVGAFFALKIYWQRFKAFLSNLFSKKEKTG